MIVPNTLAHQFGLHFQIITGKHVYLHLLSLSSVFKIKGFEMLPPNQIFSNVILKYRGKRAGLLLTLQNVFIFLFLGNKI